VTCCIVTSPPRDFTYVAAWCGTVYVAFVVDIYSRAIVGWSAATHKRARLVLDALQMALWRRDRDGHPPGPRLILSHSKMGSASLACGSAVSQAAWL
jgi:putative transposase